MMHCLIQKNKTKTKHTIVQKDAHHFLLGTEERVALQHLVSLVLNDVRKHFVVHFVGCAVRYSGWSKLIKKTKVTTELFRGK